MKDISVITVNYNTADLIRGCIESVLRQSDCNYEMIVVDNASSDNSVSVLNDYKDRITFVSNTHNLGFGKANNQAFKLSRGRYLFLLNPDAVLLSSNDLQNAVRYMDENLAFGLVGTRIIDSQQNHIVTISDHYPRQKQTSVDFSKLPGKWATVLGASMIIRRDVFDAVDGFDEDFFLYAEETDLCLRIRKQGYHIGYANDISVLHIGGASERKSTPEQVIRRKKHAKYLFYRKHYHRDDVMQIAKKDFKQAKWNWLRLSLKKKVFGLSPKDEEKMLRHRVTCEITNELLQIL